MNKYSDRSTNNLAECDNRLNVLFNAVLKEFDHTVYEGHRPEVEQDVAFRTGKSKVQWPNSKHNSLPSKAVDVAPYPIDFDDTNRMYYFAGFVKAKAIELGIPIRWGGDWDGDTEVNDQTFMDLVHFEIDE